MRELEARGQRESVCERESERERLRGRVEAETQGWVRCGAHAGAPLDPSFERFSLTIEVLSSLSAVAKGDTKTICDCFLSIFPTYKRLFDTHTSIYDQCAVPHLANGQSQ